MAFLSNGIRDVLTFGQHAYKCGFEITRGAIAIPFHIAQITSSTAIAILTGRDTSNFDQIYQLNKFLVERDNKIDGLTAALSSETTTRKLYQIATATLASLSVYLLYANQACK